MLVENTLLKTDCHFLLLLVGFDTLTYQKDYDRSPILVGHERESLSCWSTDGLPHYLPQSSASSRPPWRLLTLWMDAGDLAAAAGA